MKTEREQVARSGEHSQRAAGDLPFPAIGSWVVDTRMERTAVVSDVISGRLYLRRPGGGVEWDAMPAHVRPATEQEQLSARVAEANQRSRFGGVA